MVMQIEIEIGLSLRLVRKRDLCIEEASGATERFWELATAGV